MKPMLHSPEAKASRLAGFTLLELLVVMAIIIIIGSLATLVTLPTVRSLALTSGSSDVVSLLREAREEAMLHNRPVQFRSYQTTADGDPTLRFNEFAIGYMDGSSGVFTPIRVKYRLATGLAALDDPGYSTLLDDSGLAGGGGFLTIGTEDRSGTSGSASGAAFMVPFVGFTFEPDGTVSLPLLKTVSPPNNDGRSWNLTLVSIQEGNTFPGTPLPKNFTTIELRPRTGQVTTIRP